MTNSNGTDTGAVQQKQKNTTDGNQNSAHKKARKLIKALLIRR